MTYSIYQAILRISALTLALVLLFVSGIFSPITQQLSQNTGSYLASAIGMRASVLPTELDTTLEQSEQRDTTVSPRETPMQLEDSFKNMNDTPTYILSILLFITLVLILLNYILDYYRGRQLSSVDNKK